MQTVIAVLAIIVTLVATVVLGLIGVAMAYFLRVVADSMRPADQPSASDPAESGWQPPPAPVYQPGDDPTDQYLPDGYIPYQADRPLISDQLFNGLAFPDDLGNIDPDEPTIMPDGSVIYGGSVISPGRSDDIEGI